MAIGWSGQGTEIRATLLRLNRYGAAFEIYNPALVLRSSEVLKEFTITKHDQVIYAGRAVVRSLVNMGTVVVCEVSLDDSCFDADFFSAIGQADQLSKHFDTFIQQWQNICKVRREFKVAVADIQTFLIELRRWLEQIELGLRVSPQSDLAALERATIDKVSSQTNLILDNLFEKFERIAATLDESSQPAHRSYIQQHLHPIVLCAPFCFRTYQKPLGYAGDYEMVNMMLRDPQEGNSLFAKVFNVWLLHQGSAAAHRNRIRYLNQHLTQESLRGLNRGKPIRILNLGCGPAVEIRNFLSQGSLADNAEFTLLDFNDETIQHASQLINEAKARFDRKTNIQFQKKSVHQVLKEGSRPIAGLPEAQYDFIYCAGLFDYLSNRTCKQLMNIFWDWLAPGGLVIATNVTDLTPNRGSLDLILDWHLIYRDVAGVTMLTPDAAPADLIRVYVDDTGINVFLEARKPNGN